ncbi:ATP-binding protein [Streptomyces inhibens]|uniref:ATP-binding protein n=1 Tax=Streptomyces inhibens TaxID=2293571 RepID=A0A371QAM2_STRIH|nr:ATP-binding protein [Streptomyces inhibens]REK91761.1 ATP-binding protein [Streptomyces inhibens]
MTTHPAETVHDSLRDEPGEDAWWMPGPDAFAACALSSSACTVAEARNFTRATLQGWKMCADVTEDAALVVSELVSNALSYGIEPAEEDDAPSAPAALGPAWLALTRQDTTVLCAVSDTGAGAPVVKPLDALAESGRGLRIVDRLSDTWGWTPDHSGKTVWATVSMGG